MSKFKEKLINFIDSVEYWFSDGDNKGVSLWKTALLGLTIITPLFFIMAAPWLSWIAISPEHRYDEKYNWLQDMSWIWPVCIFALGFIGVLVSIIYNSINDR